jgi:hypothetical protein
MLRKFHILEVVEGEGTFREVDGEEGSMLSAGL